MKQIYLIFIRIWFDSNCFFLKKKADPDVFYKFSPVLMENDPYETVNVWMRQSNLNPRHLIPALLRYDHKKLMEKATQVTSYFPFFVKFIF